MSFDFAFALSILPVLLQGAVLTILATIGGFAGALVGGAIVATMYRSHIKALRFIAIGFVYVIRNTPLLVQLYFVFYVLPSFGITIGALSAGILGLSLHYSAFIAEVYRAGIGAVPVGQFEAADALGLGTIQKWALVIAPQALKPILPVLGKLPDRHVQGDANPGDHHGHRTVWRRPGCGGQDLSLQRALHSGGADLPCHQHSLFAACQAAG